MDSNSATSPDSRSAEGDDSSALVPGAPRSMLVATTHTLPTELIGVVMQHLARDPDVSSGASDLYQMIGRVAEGDADTWTAEATVAALMDATASTVDDLCGELAWAGVIVRSWHARAHRQVRLANVAELNEHRITA